ncbi:bacteriophage holin [Amycolatopsis benzoatilytica]|uniref:bacteriophage holin n=1 Tax=Amycolatopsis benzoatilytica TaxID=346045 RepID=UPI00035CFF70|nr:bacteriophage holin [Amycolatopsis benzoatilytica]
MPYLPVWILLAAGVLLLVLLLVRIFGVLRRFRRTVSMVSTRTQDRAGLIRARSAALRVAVAERRPARSNQ